MNNPYIDIECDLYAWCSGHRADENADQAAWHHGDVVEVVGVDGSIKAMVSINTNDESTVFSFDTEWEADAQEFESDLVELRKMLDHLETAMRKFRATGEVTGIVPLPDPGGSPTEVVFLEPTGGDAA